MYILLVFLALSSVSTHDINVGSSSEGKKVFDEHFQASPAVWRQIQNVTINTTDDEVISRIVVTDLREDKDGDAKIVDGGEGQKKVTIELKSPTVLRGYDFNVQVYAAPNKEFINPKNGPNHPSEFKSNAGSSNTPNPRDKPSNIETAQSNPRDTRDTEVKNLEPPSVFGQKSITTASPSVSVTIANRQLSDDPEDDKETTDRPTLKTTKDEVRNVRDTDTDADSTAKNIPKFGSFDIKTTTTTIKTPSYNLNNPVIQRSHPVPAGTIEGQEDEIKNVSPVKSNQQNPTVYTPNLDGNVPSLINSEGKPSNVPSGILNNKKRIARDTQTEAKQLNSPKIKGLTFPAITSKNVQNDTEDEGRKTRSAQEGPKITPLNVDDETSDQQSSVKPPGILTKSQNYPVPYPYEVTTKAGSTTKTPFKRETESEVKTDDKNAKLNPETFGIFETSTKPASTTKSPFKRDTLASEAKTADTNANLSPKSAGSFESTTKLSSTTKSPFKRDTGSSEEFKDDDKNTKLNPKSLGTFESTAKISSTTKSPVKRDTGFTKLSKDNDTNVKLDPKSLGSFQSTTKVTSTTKSPVKRDTASSEEFKDNDKYAKLNPKSLGTFETTSKIIPTTKSPVKRDTGSSEDLKNDDKDEKLNPKTLGSFESTSKVTSTTKSPVKRDTESSEEPKESSKETKINDKNVKLIPKSFGTFESTTNIASTTKSAHKRDAEESILDDENIKVIPKVIGSHNATSHDHKGPVVSLQ